MSQADPRILRLADLKKNLETFDQNLTTIRSLWAPEASTALDPEVSALKEKLGAPAAAWDAHFERYKACAAQFARKISKPDEMQRGEALPFLRAAYSLFVQAKYTLRHRSVDAAASTIRLILDDQDWKFGRGLKQKYYEPYSHMRTSMNTAQDEWESLLKEMNMIPLMESHKKRLFRIFEKDPAVETIASIEEDGTVTVITPGREISLDLKAFRDSVESGGSAEQCRQGCSVTEKELHTIYKSDDYEAGSVKKGATAVAWTTIPPRSHLYTGSPDQTVWTDQDGKESIGVQLQTLC